MVWIELLIPDRISRQLGVTRNSHKLGFYSTLAAISIEGSIVEQTSEIIEKFPEITHSYL